MDGVHGVAQRKRVKLATLETCDSWNLRLFERYGTRRSGRGFPARRAPWRLLTSELRPLIIYEFEGLKNQTHQRSGGSGLVLDLTGTAYFGPLSEPVTTICQKRAGQG